MQLPVNQFKRALASGKPQYGIWSALGNAIGIEQVAAADFDWMALDAEHGPNEVLTILAQLQAVAAYRSCPVVRLPSRDATLIKRYLDIGAQNLLIPMVDTAAQARALVAATHYAPAGMRGMATMTRAARWSRVPDYVQRAREEICLMVQVESVTALANIDAIAGTEGVDAVFIGPTDLSASMGHAGQANHPGVVVAIKQALGRIRAAGKSAGILCLDDKLVQPYVEAGCNFIAVGVDVVLLTRAVDALRAKYLGATTAAPAGY
jgi:4-hydroxy-2-oxoheptanedioate aldolase